nr:MAG TPA: minor capsid protein [Caudoviricetes sp.]
MILEDIVRRIKKSGKITSTADWQINRLRIIGYSSEDIEKMIKETLKLSYPEVFELYDKIIDWEYVRNKDIYEQVNAKYIPYEENKELQQLTEGFIQQSNEDLRNITQSMGFYVDYGNGKLVMTPLADIYQNYLDQAIAGVVYGTFDYNTMIRKVVTQLTNSGLRYVDYASGWHNRVDVAARRAVMTGVSQLTGKISDINAKKLGTEHFEVAWHSGARPSHAVWQGKIWSRKELVTVCGLGTGPGLLGWNCYHEYYPFLKGISERNWTDEWLEEQNRKESTPKTFNGKEYTLYEAKQQQRKMETAMRAQREKVVLLKQGGADPDDVMIARAKYQGQLDEYARFCKKMKLVQERERIYYDMRGRIATNTKDQNRKYTADMIRNADRDSKQYYRYKNIIGADIGSLEKFRQMKYNEPEKFSFIKLDYERRTELLKNPDKKLPNAENVILPEGKFTKYLFDGEHTNGLAKGRAISSRLGYSIENWQEFRDAIQKGAVKYPAVKKESDGHGQRYEQKMVLMGLKNNPANVVVGWIQRPNGEVNMTSAYLKEV